MVLEISSEHNTRGDSGFLSTSLGRGHQGTLITTRKRSDSDVDFSVSSVFTEKTLSYWGCRTLLMEGVKIEHEALLRTYPYT